MSYSLSIYSFVNGEAARPDMDAVRAVLSPYAVVPEKVNGDGDDTEFWIRAGDGSEVEIFIAEYDIGVHRPQVGDVWKIIIELADRVGAIFIPNGTFLCREEMRGHLPEGMEDGSVFVPAITLEAFEGVAGPFNYPLIQALPQ
ncbi:hypothetical protein ACWDR3_07330 [Streptomyces sp. NPDC001002]